MSGPLAGISGLGGAYPGNFRKGTGMIERIAGDGVNRAKVTCDECGRQEVVSCRYSSRNREGLQPDVGQVNRKMIAKGWGIVRRSMLCPTCEARRRAMQAAVKRADPAKLVGWAKLNITENRGGSMEQSAQDAGLRRPSREQKRHIMGLLEASYDVAGQRYRGADTDKAVAEAIGDGVLPGWVAELRDEFFGPAGDNEEMSVVLAEAEALRGRADTLEREALERGKLLRDALVVVDRMAADAVDMRQSSSDLIRRLGAIRKAVGPKARG